MVFKHRFWFCNDRAMHRPMCPNGFDRIKNKKGLSYYFNRE